MKLSNKRQRFQSASIETGEKISVYQFKTRKVVQFRKRIFSFPLHPPSQLEMRNRIELQSFVPPSSLFPLTAAKKERKRKRDDRLQAVNKFHIQLYVPLDFLWSVGEHMGTERRTTKRAFPRASFSSPARSICAVRLEM